MNFIEMYKTLKIFIFHIVTFTEITLFLKSTCNELRYLLVGETSQGSGSGEQENDSDST